MTVPPAKEPPDLRYSLLSSALRRRGISVLHQTRDRLFDIVDGGFDAWAANEVLGLSEHDAFPAPIATTFADAFDRCIDRKEPMQFEFDATNAQRRAYFMGEMQLDEQGVLTIVTDVTESRASEQAVAALLREVSHRSKNLLAIVQAVAMQTAVHSGGIQDFLDKFRGRLHALSGTQDLVTESNWRGTHLQSLVAAQLVRVSKPAMANLHITGENPILGPNASLHIGLAIHELASNAVRHGAFAPDRAGQVWLDASFSARETGGSDLVIEWRESGVSVDPLPSAPRFGTLVLERIVPLSVGGTAEYHLTADTVSYRLHVPPDQFES